MVKELPFFRGIACLIKSFWGNGWQREVSLEMQKREKRLFATLVASLDEDWYMLNSTIKVRS